VTFIKKLINKEINKTDEEEEFEENAAEDDISVDEKAKEDKKEENEKIEFVKDPNEEDIRMENVIKKAAAWMPGGKNKKKNDNQDLEWELPPISLLDSATEKAQAGDVDKNAKIIQDTLRNFGIEVELGEVTTGPTVTQYSFRPAVGVKLSRITTLSSDLALRLAARQVRRHARPGHAGLGLGFTPLRLDHPGRRFERDRLPSRRGREGGRTGCRDRAGSGAPPRAS